MFRIAYTTMALLLTMALTANGQAVFNSIEDIWKYADAHNITIRTAKHEVEKSVYSKKQSYGALLPSVNATASYTDNTSLQTTLIPGDLLPGGTPGSYRELQFGQQFVYAGGVAAQLGILNLQTWYNARIARMTEDMNRDSLANTRKSVYQQIATQYYSYLLMQEAYRLSVESSDIADSVYESVGNKFEKVR